MRNTDFLAVGEAYKAIFWPIPGFKEGIFDSSGSSAEEALIFRVCCTPGEAVIVKRFGLLLRVASKPDESAVYGLWFIFF